MSKIVAGFLWSAVACCRFGLLLAFFGVRSLGHQALDFGADHQALLVRSRQPKPKANTRERSVLPAQTIRRKENENGKERNPKRQQATALQKLPPPIGCVCLIAIQQPFGAQELFLGRIDRLFRIQCRRFGGVGSSSLTVIKSGLEQTLWTER